jgi:hypothetical protein
VERDIDEAPPSGDAAAPPIAEEEAPAIDIVGTRQRQTVLPPAEPPSTAPPSAPPPQDAVVAPEPQVVREDDVRSLVPEIQRRDTRFPAEPRQEAMAMQLDPRELVAGLLDRWERTLEQRIYAEQRQRFESELNARQNLVKQLQLELQTVRAENAATLAERDRKLAENERSMSQLQQELTSAREASKRRGWFRRH